PQNALRRHQWLSGARIPSLLEFPASPKLTNSLDPGCMTRMLETIEIGGGPYGLSATAHLRKAGVETKTFGSPMSFWRDHAPAGMLLRSALSASDIGSPDRGMSLATYLGDRSGSRRD